MAKYYFTESISKYHSPSLSEKDMGHMECSNWLRKNDIGTMSRKQRVFIAECIKAGKMVNNFSVKEGLFYSRKLWKEDAWAENKKFIIEDTEQGRHFLDSSEGKELISYRYEQVDEDGKNELIKKYFMDYFVD